MAICKRSVDGKIHRPHIFVFLPIGDEVRSDCRCKGKARGLMKAVRNGWIRALKGDAGGASNPRKIKSPTCPDMLVAIFQQHKFMTLGEMAETLDCRRLDDRRMAADAAWEMASRMCDLGDPRYPKWVADRELFRRAAFDILIGPAIARHSGDKPIRAIERIVAAVCARIARDWDPEQVSRPPDRGAMCLPADMPLEKKWNLTGPWSGGKRRSKTVVRMAAEIAVIEATGRPATEVDIVDTKKFGKAVYRRLDEAMALHILQSHSVAGKKGTDPIIETAVDAPSISLSTSIESPSIEPAKPISIAACSPSTDDGGEPASMNPSLAQSAVVDHAGENAMSAFLRPPRKCDAGTAKTEATQTAKTRIGSSSGDGESLHAFLPESSETEGKPGSADRSRGGSSNYLAVLQRLARISRTIVRTDDAGSVGPVAAGDAGRQQQATLHGEGNTAAVGPVAVSDEKPCFRLVESRSSLQIDHYRESRRSGTMMLLDMLRAPH